MKRIRYDDRGVTMTELLVSMLLITAVMAGVGTALLSARKVFAYTDDDATGSLDVRTAVERLGRDIRNARGLDSGATRGSLQLWVDANSDYRRQAAETITWTIVVRGDHYDVARQVGSGPAQTQASTVVSAIAFCYRTEVAADVPTRPTRPAGRNGRKGDRRGDDDDVRPQGSTTGASARLGDLHRAIEERRHEPASPVHGGRRWRRHDHGHGRCRHREHARPDLLEPGRQQPAVVAAALQLRVRAGRRRGRASTRPWRPSPRPTTARRRPTFTTPGSCAVGGAHGGAGGHGRRGASLDPRRSARPAHLVHREQRVR